MTSEGDESIDGLVKQICKDFLRQHEFKIKFQTFLTKVEVPCGWEDKGYKLNQGHPTYEYRLKILKNLVRQKKSEGFSLTKETSKEFFDELNQILKNDDSFPDSHDSRSKHGIDLFEQNVKLQGVVVRKSEEKQKASVLIKQEDCGKCGDASSLSLCELVVSLQDEGEHGKGFHLKVSVGDIVEVTKCRRKEGEGLEPDIIK